MGHSIQNFTFWNPPSQNRLIFAHNNLKHYPDRRFCSFGDIRNSFRTRLPWTWLVQEISKMSKSANRRLWAGGMFWGVDDEFSYVIRDVEHVGCIQTDIASLWVCKFREMWKKIGSKVKNQYVRRPSSTILIVASLESIKLQLLDYVRNRFGKWQLKLWVSGKDIA